MRGLFEWGRKIDAQGGGEAIVVDFRGGSRVEAAVVGVKGAFSGGALAPHLIALALNRKPASDIESAVAGSGVPFTFVRTRSFDAAAKAVRTTVSGPRLVATVVTGEGEESEAGSNEETARTLSRITNRPIVYVDVPENIARHSMRQLGVPPALARELLGGFAPGLSVRIVTN